MLKRALCVLLVLILAIPILPGCKKNGGDGGGDAADPTVPGEQTEIVPLDFSGYQQTYVEEIVREVSAEDVVRNQPYVVTDERAEILIDTLDFALSSKEVKNILGLDLGATLSGLTEKIYTDDLINLAVQYLYPLVEKEFAKVWAGLPENLEIKDVETGVAVAPKANVKADLYIDDIEDALESIQFYLFPQKLAAHLPAEYAAAAQKLSLASTRSAYDPETDVMTTPWEDAAILNAEGKLDVPWGVHDRESFLSAFSAALSGVEPLLLALLVNKPCDNRGLIGTGAGHASVAGGIVKLDMAINSIELVLTATANPGYNNTVAPIFEALGVAAPDGNAFGSLRDILEKGLIEPVEALLARVSAAPLDFVLKALPNLAYAIEGQMVVPLLSMLKTEINYTTNAKYTVQIAGDGEMNDAYKSDAPIRINVGEMIDLPSMGVDISSLNGLLALANKALGVTLPPLDGTRLATLGTLTWRDTVRNEATYTGGEAGKAAYIQANRADVLLFLLEYLLNGLKDKTLLTGILEKVGGGSALPELVTDVIDRVTAAPRNAIAALTELVVPQSYSEPTSLRWKEAGAPTNTAAQLYNDFWTREKAAYMTQNLPSLVDNVLRMTELNIAGITASGLPELVDGLVGLVCKPDLLNKLAAKVTGLVAGISLPDAVSRLLKEKLGFDIHYWESYRADFAEGDREAFKATVSDLLSPVQKVITFLLSDEDITINLSSENGSELRFLHLHGFDAYAQAIIPLLEMLGAQNLPTPAAFKADSRNAFSHILDAIFGVVDGLRADPYGKITTLLPNLLCFLRYGGLTAVMDNLLYSVNLLLDTVRPIYNVDLSSLIDFDLRFEKTDPIPLVFGLLSNVLRDKLGVNMQFNFTTESLYNALNTGTVETYTSANGSTAYRVNEASINREDLLTVVYDYLLKELLFSENTPVFLGFVKEKFGLNDMVYSYLERVLPALQSTDAAHPGAGKSLIFWVFFVAEALVGAAGGNISGGSPDILGILTALTGSASAEKRNFALSEFRKDMGKPGFSDVLTSVLTPLFQR